MNSTRSKSFCKDVLPIPQFRGTCWFNSLLMSIFYSELMREFFIKELPNIREHLKEHPKILNILEDLLFNNYNVHNKNNDNFYEVFKPENILIELHKANKNIFYIDEQMIDDGWDGAIYIIEMFKFLNVRNKILYLRSIPDSTSHKKKPILNISRKNYDLESIQRNDNDVNNILKFKNKPDDLMRLGSTNPLYQFIYVNPGRDYIIKDYTSYNIPDDVDILNIDYDVNDGFVPPERMKFKNATFVLDSMMIHNFNAKECNAGHAIAGITCKSKKYLYNGWTHKTNDPALLKVSKHIENQIREKKLEILDLYKDKFLNNNQDKPKLSKLEIERLMVIKSEMEILIEEKLWNQSRIKSNSKPCNLARYDWSRHTDNICIDLQKCSYPKTTLKNTLCFNMSKGKRSYLYVRKKFRENVDKELKRDKECPEDQILNPATNRCVSKYGVKGRRLLNESNTVHETHNNEKNNSSKKEKVKICSEDKIVNPATNRCVSKTGAKGKQLLNESVIINRPKFDDKNDSKKKKVKICSERQIVNPTTNRCVSKTGTIGRQLLKNK